MGGHILGPELLFCKNVCDSGWVVDVVVVVDEGGLEHAKFLREDFSMQFLHEIIKRDLTDLLWCFIFTDSQEAHMWPRLENVSKF